MVSSSEELSENLNEAPYLVIKNLSKRFGSIPVLSNVSLNINKGEIFGIIGESGSGKTTLLNTLVGFIAPDSGDILIRVRRKHKTSKKIKGIGITGKSSLSKNDEADELRQILEEIKQLNMRVGHLENLLEKRKTSAQKQTSKYESEHSKPTTSAFNDSLKINVHEQAESSYNSPNDLSSKPHYISIFKKLDKIKKIFGFSTQQTSFYEKLTVKENLDYFGELFGVPYKIRKINIKTLLKFLELHEVRNVIASNLSGGMQKRLDIACALISNPKILILDEPTSNLDPVLRRHIYEILLQIKEAGTTIIIASHFLEELDDLCDHVAVLDKGVVLYSGTPSDIVSQLDVSYKVLLKTQSGKYSYFDMPHLLSKEGYLIIETKDPYKVTEKINNLVKRHKDHIISLEIKRPSLASAFSKLKNGKNNQDNSKEHKGIA